MEISTEKIFDKLAIVLLAAGESKRFGSPKQLIEINGEFLINRVLKKIDQIGLNKSICVLGSNYSQINEKININIEVIYSENWEIGISESIKSGLKFLNNKIDGIIYLVVDQYLINVDVIHNLIREFLINPHKIIASKYSVGYGVPALFPKEYFKEIENLSGDTGCKKIILNNLENTVFIDFPEGNLDIDTFQDFEKAKELLNNID